MIKNNHNKEVGSNVERTDQRIDLTGEVFTPIECCSNMIEHIPISTLKNKESVFLDMSAGSGNFLIALKHKLMTYHSEKVFSIKTYSIFVIGKQCLHIF